MTSQPSGPTRRTVLGLAVTVGAGSLVAACGGGEEDTAGPESSAAESSSPAGPGSTSAGAGAGGALVATADVPVGSGVILDDEDVVVTQPVAGEFKAFSSICTHQNCPVNSVTDRIGCMCHGSRFSIADGTPNRGPATRPLREIAVRVEGDSVVRA